MDHQEKPSKISLFVRELCKGQTESEIQEAEENFRKYLLVVKGICDRLEAERQLSSPLDEYQTEE